MYVCGARYPTVHSKITSASLSALRMNEIVHLRVDLERARCEAGTPAVSASNIHRHGKITLLSARSSYQILIEI